MPVVHIEPTDEYPTPYDVRDEDTGSFEEEMAVVANTAELQQALGAEVTDEDVEHATQEDLLTKAIDKKNKHALRTPALALSAATFLREYGSQVALDVAATRSAITQKLMELANCGDPKYELRALELLGKHSDIGLFTDRSEVTINYKDPTELETAIRERVKRLLHADIIDVTPVGVDIDTALGFADFEPIPLPKAPRPRPGPYEEFPNDAPPAHVPTEAEVGESPA